MSERIVNTWVGGGPWTRHGHPVDGFTVHGTPPPRARCGGPAICSQCSQDAERIIAARPAKPPGELLSDEWWAQLFRATSDAVDHVPYAAASEYPVPQVAAFRAAAEPLLAPLLADQATVKRVEALVAFYDRHEYSALEVDDLRRALDGTNRG